MERRLYIEYMGDSIELPLGETIVGRDVGCALRFNDPSVSRRHLRFVHRSDNVFVEDLKSSNGTLVNGSVVSTPIQLDDGDEIVVGSRVITVRVLDAADPEAEPSTLIIGEGKPISARTAEAQFAEFPETEGRESRAKTTQFPRVTDGSRAMSSPTIPPPAKIPLRRHDRVPVDLRLIYVSDELEIEATTLDLSQSGVFVRTQIFDPVGTRCKLTILIDGGPAIQIGGVVRRVVESDDPRGDPNGLGVEFSQLGARERAWIDIAVVRITS